MERSGTTLLSMMVGAHKQIAVPLATTGMWIDFADRLGDFGHLSTKEEVARLVDVIRSHDRIRLWDAALDPAALKENLPLGDYGAIVARFHAEYARAKGKPFWANVDIATLDHMDKVNSWFSDARFLHIVRDGRDVALSHQTMPYGAGNIAECARSWVNRTTTNSKMGRILGPQRYLTIRFEELVVDTCASLETICTFLGVGFDGSMLRYDNMVEEKIPKDRRWLWPAISRPPQAGNAGRWRTAMTRSQRIVFEGIANEALRFWGYDAYGTIPKSAAAYLLDMWYHLDQGGRLQRLRRRLGMKTPSVLERQAAKTREKVS
jgi:hypothetical protein